MESSNDRPKLPRKEAESWRENWRESCAAGQPLTKDTPRGFLLDRKTVEKVLEQSEAISGLWVSFGQPERGGEMKLILEGYTGEGDPLPNEKLTNDEEIYDDFGTCCPRKS